jgi:hypothetical protein
MAAAAQAVARTLIGTDDKISQKWNWPWRVKRALDAFKQVRQVRLSHPAGFECCVPVG